MKHLNFRLLIYLNIKVIEKAIIQTLFAISI